MYEKEDVEELDASSTPRSRRPNRRLLEAIRRVFDELDRGDPKAIGAILSPEF